jgi:hypothetical protein
MMNLQMRMAVRSVAKQFPTAIVSGRCRDKVHTCTQQSTPIAGHHLHRALVTNHQRNQANWWGSIAQVFEFVKLAELYYAGSHGMDIKGPAKSSSGHAKSKVNKSSSRPSPIKHGRSIYLISAATPYLFARIFWSHHTHIPTKALYLLSLAQAKGVLFQPASEFLPMIEQVRPHAFTLTTHPRFTS